VYPVFEFCAGGETVDKGDGAPLRQFLGAELKKEKLPAYKVRLAEAAPCSPEEARLLHVKASVPLLVIHSTMYDVEGRPVEHGVAKQRGDRAQVEIAVVAAK